MEISRRKDNLQTGMEEREQQITVATLSNQVARYSVQGQGGKAIFFPGDAKDRLVGEREGGWWSEEEQEEEEKGEEEEKDVGITEVIKYQVISSWLRFV